jgi:pimeloyl-ACP methyl ester carboxylesterase
MIGYDRTGTGPPLVLLHALGSSRRAWDPVIERLAAQRDVIALDLPGFGESPPLEASTARDPMALAAAVDSFLDGLDLGTRPHVAGNSLGGWVGLEMAAAGKAASVTALAPAGLWERPLAPKPSSAYRLVRRLRPLLPLLMRSPRIRRLAVAGSIAHPERVPPEAALAMVTTYAASSDFIAVNNAMRAGHFTAWEEIDIPVTLAWAEHDRIVGPPAKVHARTVVLHGTGHLPMWDDPQQVAEVILAGSSG